MRSACLFSLHHGFVKYVAKEASDIVHKLNLAGSWSPNWSHAEVQLLQTISLDPNNKFGRERMARLQSVMNIEMVKRYRSQDGERK